MFQAFLPVFGIGLVFFCTAYLYFVKASGVALYLDHFSGFSKDDQFGKVGVQDVIGGFFLKGNCVVELAFFQTQCVQLVQSAVGTVNIELTLLEVVEIPAETKLSCGTSTTEQGE